MGPIRHLFMKLREDPFRVSEPSIGDEAPGVIALLEIVSPFRNDFQSGLGEGGSIIDDLDQLIDPLRSDSEAIKKDS